MRRSPYEPSFSRRPARIMEPAMGASTWAFGNHKWNKKIGILTRKAREVESHQARERASENLGRVHKGRGSIRWKFK